MNVTLLSCITNIKSYLPTLQQNIFENADAFYYPLQNLHRSGAYFRFDKYLFASIMIIMQKHMKTDFQSIFIFPSRIFVNEIRQPSVKRPKLEWNGTK